MDFSLRSRQTQGKFWASLLFWVLSLAVAQDTAAPVEAPVTTAPTSSGWQGCEDPETGKQLVTIGQPTTVCLTIADGVDWTSESRTYMRLNFRPIADDYSRFHVPKSFSNIFAVTDSNMAKMSESQIAVHASSQTSLSYQKWYFNGGEKVFPYLTAIIDVKQGVVKGITWDDATVFCGKSEAEPNTFDYNGTLGTEKSFGQPVEGCFLSMDDICVPDAAAGGTRCDLLLYVVWTGTDSTGKAFMSSSFRFSAFPNQNWADRILNTLPDVPDIPDIPFLNGNSTDSSEGGN